jgi:DNA-binding winged helix-turn-helix (wHTH) protein
MRLEPLPITFRESEVNQIIDLLRAGESCAVVGIGSVGKSNFLRFLEREDVRRAKLGQAWDTYLFPYIDPNKLIEQTMWGLFELMLHQLIISLTNHGTDSGTLQMVDDYHQRSIAPSTRDLALRYVDRAIGIVCGQLGLQVVFLIDEFDNLCRMLPARGFAVMRALRDDHKYQVMYVVAMRSELAHLREEAAVIEPFEELVSPNTIWLGPYSEADARCMLQRLEARHSIHLDEGATCHLLAATGGHPGLLRAAYQAAMERPRDLPSALARDARVQDECRRIWLSLTHEEQRTMAQLVSRSVAAHEHADNLEQLRHKGMVGGPWAGSGETFAPLFAQYVLCEKPVIGGHIHVDRQRHMVWIGEHAIKDLTALEYKLVEYLEGKRGQVCSRDELAWELYPEDMARDAGGVSDARLDAIVKRVRQRIDTAPGGQRYIFTVRGQGFRLTDGDEGARHTVPSETTTR